ncbi:hypothetical protein, partial [Citreimonas sp.]|uniref:hypothetical protein n=1 Tax=Citreimonas sp. TaxID=3036715 RepID=UPI0035C7D179
TGLSRRGSRVRAPSTAPFRPFPNIVSDAWMPDRFGALGFFTHTAGQPSALALDPLNRNP